jgi:hypothetical protein
VCRPHRTDPEGQEDRGGQRIAQAGERDRRQVQIVEPDLDEDPGRRPQEGHEQRLGYRQGVLAAGARWRKERIGQSRPR